MYSQKINENFLLKKFNENFLLKKFNEIAMIEDLLEQKQAFEQYLKDHSTELNNHSLNNTIKLMLKNIDIKLKEKESDEKELDEKKIPEKDKIVFMEDSEDEFELQFVLEGVGSNLSKSGVFKESKQIQNKDKEEEQFTLDL